MNSCCYGCTERSISCHIRCEKYLAFLAEVRRIRRAGRGIESEAIWEARRNHRDRKMRRRR